MGYGSDDVIGEVGGLGRVWKVHIARLPSFRGAKGDRLLALCV